MTEIKDFERSRETGKMKQFVIYIHGKGGNVMEAVQDMM